MRRINIIGATGAGKTTLARLLSQKMNIVFIDLDDIRHLPGWVERSNEDFLKIVSEKIKNDSWIVAGNYSFARERVWALADTVIWLDYSAPRNFWQLLYRSIKRIITKEPVCNGNIETWGQTFFSRKSILLWFFQSFWRRRSKLQEIFSQTETYPHIRFIRLQSPEETKNWLELL